MREIKFKAWDIDLQKMIFNVLDLKPNIYVNNIFFINHPNLIWLQYTGLKDKHGKEIYEGDIVKMDDNPEQFKGTEFHDKEDVSHHKIIWDNDRAMFTDFRLEDGDSLAGFLDGDISFVYDGEIIGNIYENPELL
jgi:uncharacterized phage protein (TIGR01671 family)